MAEHLAHIEVVDGSNPSVETNYKIEGLKYWSKFFQY